ncbi:MAG: tagatose 1,6-diphosphate aldolase, partial [Lactobacillus sp.]|nr:tagatose 1,6-diphosphate aldolase [Lactobacillus sp.]
MKNEAKLRALRRLSDENGLFQALALDQRGALKKMMEKYGTVTDDKVREFKQLVTKELTPFASAILLDPEYGLLVAKARFEKTGLLLAYEKTGYDTTKAGRVPDLLADWSVQRLKEKRADACKFLLYYDVDEKQPINARKQAFVERIGSECEAEGVPFFLELLAYDAEGLDISSKEFAERKPHKVIAMMKEFSKPRYKVDVLKVEVPVNMKYVASFGSSEAVYTRAEALRYFKEQSDATQIPFIFLSAGVSATMFQETLRFAKDAGSRFNGVLCGRAT